MVAEFTNQQIDVLLLRDTYNLRKIRHRRTAAKWRKMIQYRGVCGCCKVDPVTVSVVKERGTQKRLCAACYESALDLYMEQVVDLGLDPVYPTRP